eukprot:TRINITY_DN8563_c0_g1_i1.p2 TRINITY_DN8563_c0_g1~~TRINITY_DN8563_c0_g1_i1.p2  ORF type:complete len:144 (-),score=12.01 TRINITY_DN8563_c0_g1_i1:260-691(-)
MWRALSPMDRQQRAHKADQAQRFARKTLDKERRAQLQHVLRPRAQYLADPDFDESLSKVHCDVETASIRCIRGAHRRFRTESPPPKRHRPKGKSSKGTAGGVCSFCRPEIVNRMERQHHWRVTAHDAQKSYMGGHALLCAPCY